MSRRVRTTTTTTTSGKSSSKSKKTSISKRKITHNVIQKKISVKKSSSTKRYLEQTSSIIQPKQKRLSSLTATTLLQYCTSILSPTRKLNHSIKSTSILSNNSKTKKINIQTNKRKRQISNVSTKSDNIKLTQTDLHKPTRIHREASSRASAMIMQQNEIERSRYNYSRNNKYSTSIIRRHRTNKIDIQSEQPSIKSNKSNIPSFPIPTSSIINIPIQTEYSQSSNIITNNSIQSSLSTNTKYPLLTEAILAEHNRLYETISSKRDNLIKWTQEVDLYDRVSSSSPPPPYSQHEISHESSSINNKSTALLINNSKPIDSMTSNTISHSFEHLSTRNNPTFLFPSTTYSLNNLHSFYPILPCWQYSKKNILIVTEKSAIAWPFQSSISLHNQIQPLSINQKTSKIYSENKTKKLSILNSKQKQENLSLSKNDRLTFHLHTHHHHHIHNNNNTNSLSLQKSSSLINNNNNLIEKESKHTSTIIENNVLNLSISNKTNLNQLNGTIKTTTQRKSSPIKRRINSETKSNSSSILSIDEKISQINNSIIISPRKTINNNQSRIILSTSNNLDNKKSLKYIPKRRTISATTANSIRTISIIDKNLRKKRTNSASNISLQSTLSNKNSHQRKKQKKISNYWILFGKSEKKLVSIHSDKPPVIRECYSSIQHVIEKDIINSYDCVILRSETDTDNNNTTSYLAKVKWFWKEPTTNEIQMSLIWYYHPEHTELPAHIKEHFLPNELLASRYSDCINVACIEDKCYVLNLNEYNRYYLREKSTNFFEHSKSVGQLKSLLNRNTSIVRHRSLPATTVGNQNIFFCRYVYDYRIKRILKNPSLNNSPMITTTSSI
ncbi:unnamed protein product [Rotaria sordida]|uniref:BAH domain-containing protein n=2 Tax=Rotaria sordida TaxID=392033 RepID=A0A813XKM3_9BILA|nr:unnamed protein product [Rotaria sordida]